MGISEVFHRCCKGILSQNTDISPSPSQNQLPLCVTSLEILLRHYLLLFLEEVVPQERVSVLVAAVHDA